MIVKFMRYSQHYIEKNGSGVLSFINPHGFLDNPTLEECDGIYLKPMIKFTP